MVRQSVLFLFFFLILQSAVSYSQEKFSQEDILMLQEKELTKDEINSYLPLILELFNESSYEKIIEVSPYLIENAQRLEEQALAARLRSALGNAFIQVDNIHGAEELFTKGLEERRQASDTFGMVSAYINLGNTFFEQEPQKAIEYFEKSLELSQGVADNTVAYFVAYNNLAELYVTINKPDKAQPYLNKAKDLLELHDFNGRKQNFESTVYYVQGAIHLLQDKPREAITAIKKSMEIGGEKQDDNYKINNYKNLMQAYESLGMYREINEVRKVYDALVEKRYESNKIKQEKNATSRFNLNKYKQELRASKLENDLAAQTAQKNNLLLKTTLAIGAILLILIGSLLYGRSKRNKLLQNLRAKNRQYLEAKKRSQKLASSNTKFLSTISHELRTPLYGIIGLSSVFLEDPALKSHNDDLKSLKFSADYLLALVNDILSLNKYGSKEGERLQMSNFSLDRLIHHIGQNLEFINKKNNNSFHSIIDPEIPNTLYGDKTKISQVLMNLMSNASKFTEDGSITIKATLKKQVGKVNSILFEVKDTGQGIPEEEQANIFNEFAQAENLTTQDGTGLGLPIVNKILKILGSKLSLESSPNKGSNFYFEIDLETGSEEHVEAPFEISGYDKLKGKKILIVDDNKINQVVTKKVLEQYGIENNTASNGLEAVSMVQENTYDFILMDINMPVMNGIDASVAIREFNTTTPIIALTATNYNNESNELGKHDIDDSILKPYKTEKLLALLLHHLS